MEKKIVAITGHRPSKLGNDYELKSPLVKWIRMEILQILEREKPTQLISGMALGIDTLFALIGLELKIPIIAAVPCEGQERMWPEASKQAYYAILRNPLVTTHIVSPGPYAPWKMQVRNQWLCNNSNLLIGVWNGSSGGTKNCLDYAKSIQLPVVIINPLNFHDE